MENMSSERRRTWRGSKGLCGQPVAMNIRTSKVFEMRLETIWCVDDEVSDVNKSVITGL